MNLKETIVEIASSMGFHQTVIGSLHPMEDALVEYNEWLAAGYAARMEYLKRNPTFRTSPGLIFPGSRSAIIVSVSYFSEAPPSPGPLFGRVAHYAVGLDYHAVIRRKLGELKAALETNLNMQISAKAFTDDVALYEQAYSERHGLGFTGKNSLIIGPKLSGSYNFVAELFTDLEIDADLPYEGTCGNCFRCGSACPTGAIVEPGTVDSNLCISYLTIENKLEIPVALRAKLGDWVFGCDVCQEVCPYNQRPPKTPWQEFLPEMGVGHHLDLLSLLTLTESQFKTRFDHTPLRRPKRRGILRNTLVVLGNRLRSATSSSAEPAINIQQLTVQQLNEALAALQTFVRQEEDALLREHAVWALSQVSLPAAASAVAELVERETDADARVLMCSYAN